MNSDLDNLGGPFDVILFSAGGIMFLLLTARAFGNGAPPGVASGFIAGIASGHVAALVNRLFVALRRPRRTYGRWFVASLFPFVLGGSMFAFFPSRIASWFCVGVLCQFLLGLSLIGHKIVGPSRERE